MKRVYLMKNIEYKLTDKPLGAYTETVKEIYRLARTYFLDISMTHSVSGIYLSNLTPELFFDYIQKMEYVKDPSGIEFVNRPKISLENAGKKHPFDCDDRTVLCLAYLMAQNRREEIFRRPTKYEFRVIVAGRTTYPHHVYTEFRKIGDVNWIPFDPTYPKNVFGEPLFVGGYKTIHHETDF